MSFYKPSRNPKLHDPRSGAALLLVLMLSAVFATLGMTYWRQLHVDMAGVRIAAKESTAQALADAGIARAVAELRAGNAAFTGVEAVALGRGHYSVRITREADGTVLIASEGALGELKDPLHKQIRRARLVGAQIHYLSEAR